MVNKTSNSTKINLKMVSRAVNVITVLVIVWFFLAVGDGDEWADNLVEPFFALLVLVPLAIALIIIRALMSIGAKKGTK